MVVHPTTGHVPLTCPRRSWSDASRVYSLLSTAVAQGAGQGDARGISQMKSQAPPTLPKNKQPFVRILMPVVMVVAVVGMVAAMVLSGMGRSPMAFIFP